MTEKKSGDQLIVPNEISDETGQYDMRFLLWRQFCSQHAIPVETLPGDLESDIKEQWEEFKAARLTKPKQK